MHAVLNYRVNSNNSSVGSGNKLGFIALLKEEEEGFFDGLEEQESVPSSGKGGGNNVLYRVGTIVTSEKQKFISALVKDGGLSCGMTFSFNIPLSVFRYKGYDSDFFTSWYKIVGEIFEEIKEMCPEKRVLNLALSVLMLPYIASVSLGLVVYSRSKANGKIQNILRENKTKKNEVSESTAKRLAYSVLAAVAIFINIVMLFTLIVPATLALATFYLLNKKLSHSLVATVKIGSGLYKNEHQSIQVSFHEVVDPGELDIRWGVEIKFPPQFEQLLRDLCGDKNDKLSVTQDAEHNTVLKLLANVHLKNGLKPLRSEIGSMLATSIQGFAEAMGELLKLDKKDITYDKLRELLNELRMKAVNSVDSKLTSHLMQDAYRVALIQAIKFAQGKGKRKRDFSLEIRLKEILAEQELKNQGKKLPTEKEVIVRSLKELKRKEALDLADEDDRLEALVEVGNMTNDIGDKEFSVLKAVWEQLGKEGKIAKKAVINDRDRYPKETVEALSKAQVMIKELKEMEEKRYEEICKELRKIHGDMGENNLKDSALKRKLEDLFRFKGSDKKVEQRLIKSVIRRTKIILDQSDIADKRKKSLVEQLGNLEEETLGEVNDFISKMYLEITKCRMQSLFQKQAKSIERSCKLLEKDAPDLVKKINLRRTRVERYLKKPELLKRVIEGNEGLNKYLEDERNNKGKGHPNTKLIEQHLENNREILKALEDLKSEKEKLLINEEAKSDYREELTSYEKIKFAIIEDDLLKAFKQETFNETEIKKLLEKAELEYCLAEKCIKRPVIKTKNDVKYFCQALLSPLIGRLVNLIINNVPKNNESRLSRFWNSFKAGGGYVWVGLSATVVNKDGNVEGKALDAAHDASKEVETFLQYFESSYKEVGRLIGDVFSDDGETFKKDIWPKIRDHLCEMWDRFFKDIEFTLISKDESRNIISRKLNEVNVVQQLDQSLTV